ncbi:MAG: hypothetical protein EXS05_12885 [Planctomycetaceae bacterium]|nr:hypothetical protein [Planctomycetaceae bacterium]
MRIAIIKTGALGDVVRTTALLPALHKQHTNVDVTWIAADASLPLVERNPLIAAAVSIDNPQTASWRHRQYDWVISLDDELANCRLARTLSAKRLSGAYADRDARPQYTPDVEKWFGMGLLRPDRSGGLTRANELKRLNTASYPSLLYECLGLAGPVAPPQLHIADADTAQARQWLVDSGLERFPKLVGMNTGSGGRWLYKQWGEDQTAHLAQRLRDVLNVGVILLGGRQELERNTRIAAIANRSGIAVGPHDLSLQGFTAVVRLCSMLVTSDSLALHIAATTAITTVAFFGPTSIAEIELSGPGEKVSTPLSCRCCYLRECDIRPHCMQTIDVDTLYSSVQKWLLPRHDNAKKDS